MVVWVVLSVIDGATYKVTTVPVGSGPRFLAANPQTNRIYVANRVANTVSVINGDTNSVIDTISIGAGTGPFGVAVNPVTNFVYVTNIFANTVSAIDGETDTVGATVPVADFPLTPRANPSTDRVYVSHSGAFDPNVNTVTVIGNS